MKARIRIMKTGQRTPQRRMRQRRKRKLRDMRKSYLQSR
jgi:hypothetical protein